MANVHILASGSWLCHAKEVYTRLTQVLRRLDALLGRFLFFYTLQLQSPLPTSPQNIVIIKLFALGEATLTLPALSVIAARYPKAVITVVTTAYVAPVYQGQSSINQVHILRRNPASIALFVLTHWKKFDLAVDFEPYLYLSALLAQFVSTYSVGFATQRRERLYTHAVAYNDQQHVVRTYNNLVASPTPATALVPLRYTSSDTAVVNNYFRQHEITSDYLVALAPSVGSSAKSRQWPATRFAQVADALVERQGVKVVLLGSRHDQALIAAIQKIMRMPSVAIAHFSVKQVAALLERCRLLIANDSGLMHIGAAMGTPTLGLFGPNLPLRFRPLNRQSRYLFHPCPKSPHINVHRGEIIDGTCACMEQISVDEVFRTAKAMLK